MMDNNNVLQMPSAVSQDASTLSENVRPYNLMCKDEQFLKVNQNWV